MIVLIFYVFVKYVGIRSASGRLTMIIFYSLAFVGLSSRMAIMISLNWRPFFAEEIVILSIISQFFSLLIGSAHAWILSQLNIDLKTLQCFNME